MNEGSVSSSAPDQTLRPLQKRRRLMAALTACTAWACIMGFQAAEAASENTKGAATKNVAPRLLVVGDSLSAEYGLPRNSGWVKLLGDRLARNRFNYTVVNASISGETTVGGMTRLGALLKQHRPSIVIIELGGNDGLRGLDPAVTESNLENMIKAAKSANAQVLLIGMRLPPNYGRAYTSRFEAMFPRLAKRHGTAVLEFFMEGFAENSALFQPDRIHPNAKAQERMLDNVWPKLLPVLKR